LQSALSDRYRLEHELGVGGMATVYLAEDLKHRRKVAIKVLHAELSAVLGPDRFLKEIELTANLQHPHILPLFDSGSVYGPDKSGPYMYYVMPFVEGETLRRRIERETHLPVREALRLAREVADALEYAHKRGVIHRDIKPENILLHDGRALVADFGIALAVQQAGGTRMTQTGMSLGTPQYMAPEQAMGEKAVDARADVFALGAVTYEMLAGEPPFTGPTAQAIVAKVMTEKPAPLSKARDSVPGGVDAAVLAALAKLPADRFASAREFAEALEAGGQTSSQAGRHAAPARPVARDPRTWITAAALALAGILALCRGDGGASSPSAMTMSTLVPGADEQWQYSGATLALSPDGRHLAIIGSRTGGGSRLLLRAMDRLESIELRGTEGAIYPFWSPDGRELGFFQEGRLKVMEVASGAIRELCAVSDPRGGTWGRHGDILYAPSRVDDLHHVAAAGGACQPMPLGRSGPRQRGRPWFFPDGQHFLLTTDQQVWIGRLGEDSASFLREVSASQAYLAAPNILLTRASEGGLDAQEVDLPARRLIGRPVRVMTEGVRTPGGLLAVSASTEGHLVVGSPTGDGNAFAVVVSRRTGTVDTIPMAASGDHRLSRSGRWLAVGGWGFWILDLERRIMRQVPVALDTLRIYYRYPVWSPGDSVLAIKRAYQDRGLTLFDPRSDQARRWLDEPVEDRISVPTDWSPDGGHLLLTLEAGAGTPQDELWVQEIASGAVTRFAPDRNATRARFSPDGRWVAYQAEERGERQVYLRPFPGPGAPLRVSPDGGMSPGWGRTASELLYRSPGAGIMVVTIDAEGRAGPPRPALSGLALPPGSNAFDVAADGDRLVWTFTTGGGSALLLLQGWQSRLGGGS
jgi:serine/threonine-protein kinase